MRWHGIAALGLSLCCWPYPVQADVAPYRFFKNIDRSEAEGEQILAIPLDSEVYGAAETDLSDIRIVGPKGDVPYQIQQAVEVRTETRPEICPSHVVTLQEHDDNRIEIVVGLDKESHSATALSIRTPLKDYERRIQVLASDRADGEWTSLVKDGLIFDYTRYMDFGSSQIRLGQNSYRFFKIIVNDVTDEQQSMLTELTRQFRNEALRQRTEETTVQRRPLRVDRIELWRDVAQERVSKDLKRDYEIVSFQVEEDKEKQQTLVTIKTRRQPLTAITLETGAVNFSRGATVQVRVTQGVTTHWRDIASSTLSVIRFRGFEQEKLTLEFNEHRSEEYRIVIENEDNPPLDIGGVKASGNVYRLLVFADADDKFQVYYGSESARPPRYDTAALTTALGKGFAPAMATLGPQQKNPSFDEHADQRLLTALNNRTFFILVIGLMVVVLGFILFRAGRRIEGATCASSNQENV